MCEFKIVRQNDGSQIAEDIVIITHGENNELLFKDILGSGEILDSALILEVNTLNQTTVIVEHPLVKDFLILIKNFNKAEIESFQGKLEEIKKML